MTLLTLRGLSKSYGKTAAVNHVDLDVPAGSRTAIVGASGSGKTTLLRLVAGFETPDEGKIVLGGTVLVDGANVIPAYHRNIGYVAQEGALFPHLSVEDNIGFGIARRDPNRPARILELMRDVDLPADMRNRYPHQLSGGQQQRVALARALARRPRLMLLDEPFSALDTSLREAMRDMVGSVLSSAGITTVLVTHDQAEALSFAEYLVIMRDGLIVQTGAPQQVYLHPADEATANFLGDAILLDAEIAAGFAACAFGRLPIGTSDRSGNARIMLRPEQIEVRRHDPAAPAAFSGRVVTRSFRGPTCRLLIQPASGAATISILVSGQTALNLPEYVSLGVVGTAHVLG